MSGAPRGAAAHPNGETVAGAAGAATTNANTRWPHAETLDAQTTANPKNGCLDRRNSAPVSRRALPTKRCAQRSPGGRRILAIPRARAGSAQSLLANQSRAGPAPDARDARETRGNDAGSVKSAKRFRSTRGVRRSAHRLLAKRLTSVHGKAHSFHRPPLYPPQRPTGARSRPRSWSVA